MDEAGGEHKYCALCFVQFEESGYLFQLGFT